MSKNDPVNKPVHYTNHPSGIECIQITEHMNFNLGNALKYIWRSDLKNNAIEDLEKAIFYIKRELQLRGVEQSVHESTVLTDADLEALANEYSSVTIKLKESEGCSGNCKDCKCDDGLSFGDAEYLNNLKND